MNKNPPHFLEEVLLESIKFSTNGNGSAHMRSCERCYQDGLCVGVASYTGETPPEVRDRYYKKVLNGGKRVKRRVVRKRRTKT